MYINSFAPINFQSKTKEKPEAKKIEQKVFSNNTSSKVIRNTLVGLTALAGTTLQSCEFDFGADDDLIMSVCPKKQTVLKMTKGTTPKVNYVFHSLNILPEENDILEIDSICFSDSKNNRYIISNPQLDVSTLKLDVKKHSVGEESVNGSIHLRDVGATLKMTSDDFEVDGKYIMEDGIKSQRFNKCKHDNYTGVYKGEGQYLSKDETSFYYITPKSENEKYDNIKIVLKNNIEE